MKTQTRFAARSVRACIATLTVQIIAIGVPACAIAAVAGSAMSPVASNPEVAAAMADSRVTETASDTATQHHFNDRPIKAVRTIRMRVTAYSPDARSCGEFADGITASGYSVLTNGGRLVAADTNLLPFGSLLSIPGYDDSRIVPVLDRGGAIKQNRLDVLFPTHEEALQWGVRDLDVTVWEYADGLSIPFQPGQY